jgi:hypothetical protein
MFNEGRYWEKAQAGEFHQIVLKNRHPSLPLAREPFCTRSQIIAYHDKRGNRVAVVHQYLRLDGTVGLSGKPDPKRLLHNLELYIVTEP